jgi:hypothetical protein
VLMEGVDKGSEGHAGIRGEARGLGPRAME